jgi:apolipoprotein D and lipocalin family protein
MKRIFLLLSIFPLFALTGCMSQPDYRAETSPPETVSTVDLSQYAGLWYEIARYPNGFQQDCEGVTAEYVQRADGKITVINTCRSGDERTAKGVARVVEGSGNSKLKVQFAPEWVPFASGDYWILHLEPDYSAALVGAPSGKYLWILAREKQISDALMSKITARAQALGYETAPLKLTAQP